jgi:transglutaminase-like putative cysteine protease
MPDPDSVRSLEDFAAFARGLSTEPTEQWRSATPQAYLEALAAWVEDSFLYEGEPMHGLERPEPSWSTFATMLRAAAIYE